MIIMKRILNIFKLKTFYYLRFSVQIFLHYNISEWLRRLVSQCALLLFVEVFCVNKRLIFDLLHAKGSKWNIAKCCFHESFFLGATSRFAIWVQFQVNKILLKLSWSKRLRLTFSKKFVETKNLSPKVYSR